MKHFGKALGLLFLFASTPSLAQADRCSIGETIGRVGVYARFPGVLGGPIEYGASSSPINRLNPAFVRANQTFSRANPLNGSSHLISVYISPAITQYSLGSTMTFVADGQTLGEATGRLAGGNIRVYVPEAVRASGKPFSAIFKFNGKDQTLQFDALPDPAAWARKALVEKQRAGTLPQECRRFVGRMGTRPSGQP